MGNVRGMNRNIVPLETDFYCLQPEKRFSRWGLWQDRQARGHGQCKIVQSVARRRKRGQAHCPGWHAPAGKK